MSKEHFKTYDIACRRAGVGWFPAYRPCKPYPGIVCRECGIHIKREDDFIKHLDIAHDRWSLVLVWDAIPIIDLNPHPQDAEAGLADEVAHYSMYLTRASLVYTGFNPSCYLACLFLGSSQTPIYMPFQDVQVCYMLPQIVTYI